MSIVIKGVQRPGHPPIPRTVLTVPHPEALKGVGAPETTNVRIGPAFRFEYETDEEFWIARARRK